MKTRKKTCVSSASKKQQSRRSTAIGYICTHYIGDNRASGFNNASTHEIGIGYACKLHD